MNNNHMKLSKIAKVLAVASVIATPNMASATNGLFSHAYGAKQSGIAGSGVAFAQDAMIAAINPAGVVQLDDKSYELDIQYFSPRREYTVTASQFSGGFPPFPGPTVESGAETFIIPGFAMNRPLANDAAFGFALYGNGGMNTEYDASKTPFGIGTFGSGVIPGADTRTSIDYSQLFLNFSYSKKFSSGNGSWGVAALVNYSRFEIQGLAGFAPFSVNPGRISDQKVDTDIGFGVRLGVQYDVSQNVSLAGSYQSEISNTFDNYAGLFPQNGKLNIPATAQIGLATTLSSDGVITADIQYIFYADTEGVGDPGSTGLTTGCIPSAPFSPLPVAMGPNCLGSDPGLGFGWEDMTVFKLGYTWSSSENMTWRIGASYGGQPVQEKDVTFNILAPGVIEQHYTAGFTKTLASGNELSAALMYAPENCVSGPDLFTPGQRIELCMNQIAINVGYGF